MTRRIVASHVMSTSAKPKAKRRAKLPRGRLPDVRPRRGEEGLHEQCPEDLPIIPLPNLEVMQARIDKEIKKQSGRLPYWHKHSKVVTLGKVKHDPSSYELVVVDGEHIGYRQKSPGDR